LDDSRQGNMRDLKAAIEWCIENNIDIINMSLGSTNNTDSQVLKALMDKCCEKKIMVVCAGSNSGHVTYPASYYNVFGVAYGEVFKFVSKSLDGIQFHCPTDHGVNFEGHYSFEFEEMNSYAAPWLSAQVAKMKMENRDLNMFEVIERMTGETSIFIREYERAEDKGDQSVVYNPLYECDISFDTDIDLPFVILENCKPGLATEVLLGFKSMEYWPLIFSDTEVGGIGSYYMLQGQIEYEKMNRVINCHRSDLGIVLKNESEVWIDNLPEETVILDCKEIGSSDEVIRSIIDAFE